MRQTFVFGVGGGVWLGRVLELRPLFCFEVDLLLVFRIRSDERIRYTYPWLPTGTLSEGTHAVPGKHSRLPRRPR